MPKIFTPLRTLLSALIIALPATAFSQATDQNHNMGQTHNMNQGDAPNAPKAPMDMDSHQPYAGLEDRKIKALSPERMDGLATGKGIGYALAAELNHYPGPRHVLDMSQQLNLDAEQLKAVQSMFATMQADAITLGKRIIEGEARLDTAFAQKTVDAANLITMVGEIAALEGQLRVVHLSTHLDMQTILSPHQVMLYDKARGYLGDGEMPMNHQMNSN